MNIPPENNICKVKGFIEELSKVQDDYFRELVVSMALDEKGEEWLFDYVFNHSEEKTFGEYLENYGKTYEEFLIN